jgi:hypothetical protein
MEMKGLVDVDDTTLPTPMDAMLNSTITPTNWKNCVAEGSNPARPTAPTPRGQSLVQIIALSSRDKITSDHDSVSAVLDLHLECPPAVGCVPLSALQAPLAHLCVISRPAGSPLIQ